MGKGGGNDEVKFSDLKTESVFFTLEQNLLLVTLT